MNYYYITGTSRGLGEAFAKYLLEDANNYVTGISRNQSIEHANYKHISIDLTDMDVVKDFQFELHPEAKRIVLFNNAAAMGLIKPVGKLTAKSIIQNYSLNLITPSLLMNSFMDCYKNSTAEKIIVNVSSGAGKHPFDGWSVYCSSKAGLDMFSRVVAEEQKLIKENNFKILSIAPGIVDTKMQSDIRKASKEDFSKLNDFITYKDADQLSDPRVVSEKYLQIINNAKSIKEVLISVKDIE